MLRSILIASFVFPVLALAQPAHAPTLAIGAAPPMSDARMLGVDGRRVSIADVGGAHGTLVVFTCNHCPWAQAWQARLAEIGNNAATHGVGVIFINSNDPSEHAEDAYQPMQRVAREAGFHFAYVVDDTSNVARAFGATRTPEVFLFDAQRHLVYHGAVDDNGMEPQQVHQRYLHDAIDAVIAGHPIAQATTRSMGCGIKFRGEH